MSPPKRALAALEGTAIVAQKEAIIVLEGALVTLERAVASERSCDNSPMGWRQ